MLLVRRPLRGLPWSAAPVAGLQSRMPGSASSIEVLELRDAAARAEARWQWDEASRLYERCLTLAADGGESPSVQAALLTGLGRCYRHMAEARSAWRSLMRAITLSREADDWEGAADAALEALRVWAPPARQRVIAEDALAFLGPGESRRHVHLLLWLDRRDEALAVAKAHGYEEVLAGIALWDPGSRLIEEGRVKDYLALVRHAHDAYDAAGDLERASGALRGAGYSVLTMGDLALGERYAVEAAQYAGKRNLRFEYELAALDVVGVLFAREEFQRCTEMLDEIPGELDFRKDLYRAWIAEARGDLDEALAWLPTPDRAGGAGGALSQVHSGRAGVLWRAGREDAARHELEAWREAARADGRLIDDAPAALECILDVGDRTLLEEIRQTSEERALDHYSTLQGRGLDFVRGGVALALELPEKARAAYVAGLEWAEAAGCSRDAARCRAGLAAVDTAERNKS